MSFSSDIFAHRLSVHELAEMMNQATNMAEEERQKFSHENCGPGILAPKYLVFLVKNRENFRLVRDDLRSNLMRELIIWDPITYLISNLFGRCINDILHYLDNTRASYIEEFYAIRLYRGVLHFNREHPGFLPSLFINIMNIIINSGIEVSDAPYGEGPLGEEEWGEMVTILV